MMMAAAAVELKRAAALANVIEWKSKVNCTARTCDKMGERE